MFCRLSQKLNKQTKIYSMMDSEIAINCGGGVEEQGKMMGDPGVGWGGRDGSYASI